MRHLRVGVLLWVIVALATPQSAFARHGRSNNTSLYQLMYCAPWFGCMVAWFVYEEVEVVASYGYLDLRYDGSWGSSGGCHDCEFEAGPYAAPAPEPVEEGGSDECGNIDKNLLLTEYRDHGVTGNYHCGTFEAMGQGRFYTTPSHGSVTHSHGILQPWLVTNIEGMENYLQHWPLHISGGYRCPVRNAQVGGRPQSRHLHGTAADMYWSPSGHTETQHNLIKEAALCLTPSWSSIWTTYGDRHFHAHWGTSY